MNGVYKWMSSHIETYQRKREKVIAQIIPTYIKSMIKRKIIQNVLSLQHVNWWKVWFQFYMNVQKTRIVWRIITRSTLSDTHRESGMNTFYCSLPPNSRQQTTNTFINWSIEFIRIYISLSWIFRMVKTTGL